MKHSSHSLLRLVVGLCAGLATLATPGRAQTAVQTVTLPAGWNAVWLEVEPTYPAGDPKAGQPKIPDDVFTNPAIDIVATPKPLAGSAEFFASEPGTITTFNKDDWQQWKRTDLASTNNLAAIFGNRSYLIHTTGTTTVTLSLTGKVRFFHPTWTPDRYNLLGFGLEGTRTFSEFFSAAGTKHPVDKIFTLVPGGSWVKVAPSQAMDSGKAYWIFSAGPSNYMGPVALDFDHAVTGTLNYGGPSDAQKVGTDMLDLKELVFTNSGAAAATPSATAISPDSGLALYRVTPATTGLGYMRGNGFLAAFVPIAAKQTATLTIGAMRSFSDDAVHTSLYRLRTSPAGASFYLPVTAVKSDIQQTAAAAGGGPSGPVAGLWVGEVTVNGATSIAVDGAPTQPTAGNAPLRILLHADAGGTVRLLSQVTLMQTKTADPAVAGVPVLVVDPARIPFFEGIKERNGKRVGLRLEAVAYDMPRSASAWSGADLVTFATRPTALQEVYDLATVMTGALGQTVSATLTLDPFHRSNPLRHVYHQDLTKGPQITRTLTFAFDASQPVPDRLAGSFSDEIQGLVKDKLTLTGRVEMRRVSPVATLEGVQ
ncbi:MAG: hypothetical protein K9N23_13100 [Akkermansiaceae bacterium]|nr:hypothetical protein [Akkermansiaceae bacterium]MCF7732622.1 hypothetical protein [Akkermansiaceae bacterium]